MPDLRTSTALRQLTDLAHSPDPPRWAWVIVRLDLKGRIVLRPAARVALGGQSDGRSEVRGVCHRVALGLSPAGAGAPMTIDRRGRICLPSWLRRGHCESVLVGTNASAALVVVA